MARCRRGGAAGGADGADRNSRAPAFRAHAPLADAAPACASRLLTGRDKAARATRARSAALAAGEIDIVVGTHALFQESVAFRDLGLAVVDEQHRFGVHQRLALGEQGRGGRHSGDDRDADPAHAGAGLFRRHGRFGAREKPPGRTPIDTRALPLERLERGRRGGRPRDRGGRARLLGLPAGRGERGARRRRRRGARRGSARVFRRRGRPRPRPHEGAPTRTRRWSASSAARPRCWSPPRSSRSASTCRRRPSW